MGVNPDLKMDQQLIETLSDGEFHSGQHLGDLLGISRTAVWKHLQKLGELGISIESIKGKGYRIPGGLDLLDENSISNLLGSDVGKLVRKIVLHRTIDSTNAYIAELAEQGSRVVCLAEYQHSGRGRRGRNWISPYGKNIYLSLGWQYQGGAASLEGLSLVVGVAVLRALGAADGLGLKWPNDILFKGRKLAGILLEMQGDPSGECQIIVGIGVNHGMSVQGGTDIDQPWADASELGDWERNELVARILAELVPVLNTFGERGFSYYLEEWDKYDICRDRAVRLITPTLEIHGVARGVTRSGAVLIETDGSIESYHGGEISLRLAE